jgi:ABC-2 type transport system ATP-binding protein
LTAAPADREWPALAANRRQHQGHHGRRTVSVRPGRFIAAWRPARDLRENRRANRRQLEHVRRWNESREPRSEPAPDRRLISDVISVQHLTKRFGSHVAVHDLSFEVAAGEVLGFLGPNGAGKTTTMRMVTGYLPPSGGSVVIDGCDLLRRPIDAKRRLGYLPQDPPIYPELTVRQYLRFVAEIKDVPRARRTACVDRAVDRANLREVASKRIGALSKGFKQRVGLAQAIVHEPPVLILDEPTSSLDPKQRVEVRELIAALRGQHTVILSTHILPEVSQITDRVVIINRGQVMAVDTPANLSQRLRGREAIAVEVGGADPSEVETAAGSVAGVVMVQAAPAGDGRVTARIESELGVDVRGEVARALAIRWQLLALRSETLSLEEIFLKLTGDGDAASQEAP